MDMGLPPLEPSGPPPVEVFNDLRWVMDGFWRLSNARPQGFAGPLRIPLSELEAYCRLKGFDYAKRQDFLYYIERLDEKFMAFVQQKQEEQDRKGNNNGTPPRPGSNGSPGHRR
jgi:hypothetical protein